jgi:hypothetical protein
MVCKFIPCCNVLITTFPLKAAKVSKYDQYLQEFLLKNKELSAEKIGVFSLNRAVGDDRSSLGQYIDFQFNKRASTSDELIDYIVKETGKNKTLISSDLSSLFEDARQYINIGKTFSFAGAGLLSLNRLGEYEFTPLQRNTVALENDNPSKAKTPSEAAGSKQRSRNAVVFSAFVIIILIAAGFGWGIYKYIKQQKAEVVLTGAPESSNDTATAQNKPADTANISHTLPTAGSDSAYYRFIFETTLSKTRAHNRYDSLKSWGEHVFIDSTGSDSNTAYHLFVKAKLTVKDTAYVRDSVQKYFQRTVKIVLN